MEILVVTTIAILFFITSYISVTFLGREHWYKNLNFLFSFVFINSCVIFVSDVCGINPSFKIGFVFCLFYGPFLYLLLMPNKSLTSDTFAQSNYFVHFYFPFLILISYVVFYSIYVDNNNIIGVNNLNNLLYLLCGILGLSYGSYAYYFLIINEVGVIELRFLFFYIILLYLNTVFFISFLFANDAIIDNNTYYLLFNLSLAILLFFVCNRKFTLKYKKKLVHEEIFSKDIEDIKVKAAISASIQNNSQLVDKTISEKEIEKYRKIIYKELIESKLFLNSDLTLTMLSSMTKISKCHLTYYFKQSVANGFYDYINRIRVEYSIFILKEASESINLDEWAEACGFNSRVAFYRAFTKEKGFSPSELIQSLRVVE